MDNRAGISSHLAYAGPWSPPLEAAVDGSLPVTYDYRYAIFLDRTPRRVRDAGRSRNRRLQHRGHVGGKSAGSSLGQRSCGLEGGTSRRSHAIIGGRRDAGVAGRRTPHAARPPARHGARRFRRTASEGSPSSGPCDRSRRARLLSRAAARRQRFPFFLHDLLSTAAEPLNGTDRSNFARLGPRAAVVARFKHGDDRETYPSRPGSEGDSP